MCDRKVGQFDCCSVVCGDCLELMKQLPDGCVDAVITDPPYPNEFDHVWDYLGDPAYRISRHFLVTLCGHYQVPRVMNAVMSGGWQWFWPAIATNNNQPIMHGFKAKCCHKPALVFRKHGAMPTRIFFDDFSLRGMSGEWASSQTMHKWGQALGIFLEPIGAFTEEGGIVLDPFCGSGTTLVAAKKLGRHFLGFEISETYCEIARDRLARIDAQPSLFTPKPEQMTLGGGE